MDQLAQPKHAKELHVLYLPTKNVNWLRNVHKHATWKILVHKNFIPTISVKSYCCRTKCKWHLVQYTSVVECGASFYLSGLYLASGIPGDLTGVEWYRGGSCGRMGTKRWGFWCFYLSRGLKLKMFLNAMEYFKKQIELFRHLRLELYC